jgi:phosphoribosylaminoimidazole-succinocarboxamide synthase
MTDKVVESISSRYKELYEKVMGEPLPAVNYSLIMGRIEQNIVNSINSFNLEPQS